MDADRYQAIAFTTATFDEGARNLMSDHKYDLQDATDYLELAYCTLKLNGEAGELAEQVGKALRDDNGVITAERRSAILKELGDVQWYVAAIATGMGVTLSDIMQTNLDKLASRKERNVIHGSGDER
jgi:NTP pyrophosphatase (non-canonical NTP hydrolase)